MRFDESIKLVYKISLIIMIIDLLVTLVKGFFKKTRHNDSVNKPPEIHAHLCIDL